MEPVRWNLLVYSLTQVANSHFLISVTTLVPAISALQVAHGEVFSPLVIRGQGWEGLGGQGGPEAVNTPNSGDGDREREKSSATRVSCQPWSGQTLGTTNAT